MNTAEIVFATAQRLQQSGTPYAMVSVIRALAPASARPGDKAVVTADGVVHGWIGGGCAQPAVVRTARQVLAEGQPRLIRITPSDEGSEKDLGDVLEFGMSCHSGGTLELFIDPVLPRAQLVVIGTSPVADSLVQLAPRVGFAVTLIAHEADPTAYPDAQRVIASDDPGAVLPHVAPDAMVVVATQGRRDLQALRLALALSARQVSFVASAKKAQVLKDSLLAAGGDTTAVRAIVAPAGYPMSASTPEEIALSVLAAVVSHRRGAVRPDEAAPPPMTTRCGSASSSRALAVPGLATADASCCASPPADVPKGTDAPSATATHSCCGG